MPSPQPETVTLITVPDEVAGANTQFSALPALEKSLAVSPVIDSVNVRVNTEEPEDKGPVGTVVNVGVGGVRSRMCTPESAWPSVWYT